MNGSVHARLRALVLALASAVSACGSGSGDGGAIRTAPAGSTGAQPSDAADGTPIVFRSAGADGVGALELIAADGTGRRGLTEDGDFSVPEWSPDGKSIAFRQSVAGVNAEVGVQLLDGSSPVLLTRGESALSARQAVHWSPDGEALAYASQTPQGTSRLWLVPRTGGAPELLLPNVTANQDAADWAPTDATRLLYVEFAASRPVDLWLARGRDDAQPQNLTNGRVFAPQSPSWSPDGTRVAFTGYALAADGSVEGLDDHTGASGANPPDSEIFVLEVESGVLERLTDNDSEDEQPAWSPDGERLLITSDRDGDADLWLVPLAHPELAQDLIDDNDDPRDDRMPSWCCRHR